MSQFKLGWNNPKLATRRFGTHKGMGVIAETKIKRGEILSLFGGYVMSIEAFHQLPAAVQEFPYHIAENLLFGPLERGQLSVGDYYNHSCQPNAGFRDSITLVSMRTIQPGEEVTFDYCMCMTSTILTLKCACGGGRCRKIIRGSDWKTPELQARYKDYFVPYIKDKIARLKR